MVGYGVTNTTNEPPQSSGTFSITPLESSKVKPLPKRELTLQEKQQLAIQFESDSFAPKEISTSMSMQNMSNKKNLNKSQKNNTDLLADNLMNSNLLDLGKSANNSKCFIECLIEF